MLHMLQWDQCAVATGCRWVRLHACGCGGAKGAPRCGRGTRSAWDMERRGPPREASATSAGVPDVRVLYVPIFSVCDILCTTDLLSFKKD
jgi:hypothetical protein